MTTVAGSGHPGGALSSADIVATLYFWFLRHNPDDPNWMKRDRFILSKGHSAPVLYAALALCGYFSPNELLTLRRIDSRLQGHPSSIKTPGVEVSTGSLGQGLSVACGIAAGLRLCNSDSRVCVLLGDGELDEGQVWEAALFASHYSLSNLIAIVDFNGFQVDGKLCEVMNISPLVLKWKSFGWKVLEIDGHNIGQIVRGLKKASMYRRGPFVIIAKTVKGKGVSFLENNNDYHGKPLNESQLKAALIELGGEIYWKERDLLEMLTERCSLV